MKISFFRYIIIIFIIGFTPTHAAASTVDDFEKLLDSVKTMQASFTQTVYDNHGKVVQKSYGRMSMQRPGKFRWEVTKPIPQLIIANESRLLIYDPDLQQLTIRSLGKATGGTPALLLSHQDKILDKDFAIQPLEKNVSGWHWFSLIPKQQDSMFASIQMGFTNNQIREMRLQDHLGHMTLIQFTDAKINKTLLASLFNFKPPANVDVIDETRKN